MVLNAGVTITRRRKLYPTSGRCPGKLDNALRKMISIIKIEKKADSSSEHHLSIQYESSYLIEIIIPWLC